MLLRINLAAILLISLLFAFGCGGNPTTPVADNDLEAFFANVNPEISGIIGSYTFTGTDGSYETGMLVAGPDGEVQLVSDRGASVYSNWWFDVDVEYMNPRGYTGMGLPYYYLGDTFTYKVKVDYKRGLPLNLYPILYGKLTAEQRYYPGMQLLPGASTEVWDPFLIAPHGYVEVLDTFKIVSGTIPGNDCTVCKIDLQFMFGMFQFQLAHGICGLWDP